MMLRPLFIAAVVLGLAQSAVAASGVAKGSVNLRAGPGTNYARIATIPAGARVNALRCGRWNMLHPAESPKKSHVETVLEKENGVFVAVSDNIKLVPDQIAPWVPGGLTTLGTDGFGRSDTRPRLRRFFEVDAECTVIATLYALAQQGQVGPPVVQKAIRELAVDPEKVHPQIV